MNLLTKIEEIRAGDDPGALCIIVRSKGSTPRKTGAKMIVTLSGRIAGTIGGGNLEKEVIENAQKVIQDGEPKLFKHDLLQQHNMCCGGSVEIYIEPIVKTKKLFIFGAGHTGQALTRLAERMEFEIYVVDDRDEYLSQIEGGDVNKLNVDYKQALPFIPFDENTYIVIMTYDHAYDRDILSHCINRPSAYLGMIGSQRKIELTRKMFLDGKLATEEQLDKVDMPMGIDIHAETPEEIAVSILSKIIQVKNG